jgi:apolipoprotein N-acyltransferase
LRGLLEWLAPGLNIPAADIAPGAAEQASIRLDDGTRLGVSICYEDAFGREIRRSLPEAAVLINASNDGWFGDSIAPHQHLEIARMRSVESGRPMLRATNTGVSAIIGARGEVIGQAPQFVEDTVTVTVQRHAGITPFIAAGYLPSLAFAGLAVIAVAWTGRRRATARVEGARRAVQDR